MRGGTGQIGDGLRRTEAAERKGGDDAGLVAAWPKES